jgi:hypothetical protein
MYRTAASNFHSLAPMLHGGLTNQKSQASIAQQQDEVHYYLDPSEGVLSNHGGDSRPITAATILSQMETPKQ